MELAENHDEPVLKWKAASESVGPSSTTGAISMHEDGTSSDEETDGDEEEPGSEEEERGSEEEPGTDEALPQLTLPSGEQTTNLVRMDVTPLEDQLATVVSPKSQLQHSLTDTALKPPNYILVGDNWDKNLRPRHMTMEHGTTSLHLFHAYAIQSRVYSTDLPDDKPVADLKQMSVLAFLPSMKDCENLRNNYVALVARVLVEKLPAFKAFEDCVEAYIPHAYTEAMKQKSTVVSIIGIIQCY